MHQSSSHRSVIECAFFLTSPPRSHCCDAAWDATCEFSELFNCNISMCDTYETFSSSLYSMGERFSRNYAILKKKRNPIIINATFLFYVRAFVRSELRKGIANFFRLRKRIPVCKHTRIREDILSVWLRAQYPVV